MQMKGGKVGEKREEQTKWHMSTVVHHLLVNVSVVQTSTGSRVAEEWGKTP